MAYKIKNSKKIRDKLIGNLAKEWRSAETYFQETEDDSKKLKVLVKQRKARLSSTETKELNGILNSMGV